MSADGLARTPKPPYHAVVFTSRRTEGHDEGYAGMAERMVAIAAEEPGVSASRAHAAPTA